MVGEPVCRVLVVFCVPPGERGQPVIVLRLMPIGIAHGSFLPHLNVFQKPRLHVAICQLISEHRRQANRYARPGCRLGDLREHIQDRDVRLSHSFEHPLFAERPDAGLAAIRYVRVKH